MRDRVVLAFVERTCVGRGVVDVFRADLARAGLGDGHCGFRFPVKLADPADASQLYLKLEGSDFLLPQRGSRVVDGAMFSLTMNVDRTDYSPESIDWMRDHRWLNQTDYDFLRHITTIGLYSRILRTVTEWLDPAAEARRLFELYRQGPVQMQETVIQLRNLAAERHRLVNGASIPLLAIHAEAGAVRLMEGSRGAQHSAEVGAATRHICSGDRLLLVNARTTYTGETNDTARVFRAV